MSYSWDKIGKRIQEERKKMPSRLPKTGKRKAGYVTQAELAGLICEQFGIEDTGTYRKKVVDWESGSPVDLKDLLALCDIFCCDVHYILCETDTRYYVDIQDVEKYGLTAEALSLLREMTLDGWNGWKLEMISAMIQNKHLIDSLTDLWLSAHEDKLRALYGNRNDHDMDPWYSGEMIKQKEYELYRSLADFIEK